MSSDTTDAAIAWAAKTDDSPPKCGRLPLERSLGRAELVFKRRDAMTTIAHLHQAGCGKVRLPKPVDTHHAEAILINLAGGLTGGDRIDWRVVWQPGTTATVSGQAAEKIYRAIGKSAATIEVQLTVGSDALAIWLPQETILFDRGRLVRRSRFEIARGGRLLAAEATVMGRRAMGETVEVGLFDEGLEVRYADHLVLAERQRFQGSFSKLLARPTVAGGASAFISLLFVGDDAGRQLGAVRDTLSGLPTAVTSPDPNAVVVRWLVTEATNLRGNLMTTLFALQKALDLLQRLPRVWSC